MPSLIKGEEKCAKRDGREFFLEQTAGLRIDRGEKRETEVDLRWSVKSGLDNAGSSATRDSAMLSGKSSATKSR